MIIIEAIYVGLLVLSIGIIIIRFIKGLLGYFIIGFLKHLLGYYLGIQDYYCNYGDRCMKINEINRGQLKAKGDNIIKESLLEGIIFVILGLVIGLVINDEYLLLFLIGFKIHIISEMTGIHLYFCNYNCK